MRNRMLVRQGFIYINNGTKDDIWKISFKQRKEASQRILQLDSTNFSKSLDSIAIVICTGCVSKNLKSLTRLIN